MANLSVRKLDVHVYEQLRIRANAHGISMEEEVRQILSQAVSASDNIAEVFRRHFGEENGIDLEALSPRKPHEPMDFE